MERCPHCGGSLGEREVLRYGGWTLDEIAQQLHVGDDPAGLKLTGQQCDVLSALMRAHGRVVPMETLYDMVYGARPECDQPDPKILDVQICKIRYMARQRGWLDPIHTVWGGGRQMVDRFRATNPDMSQKSEPSGGATGSVEGVGGMPTPSSPIKAA